MLPIIIKLKQWLLAQYGFLGSETTVLENNDWQKVYDLFPTPGRNRTSSILPDYLQDEPWMDSDEVLEMFRPYIEQIIVSQNAAVRRSPSESEEEGLLAMGGWRQYLKNRKDWEKNTNSCNL